MTGAPPEEGVEITTDQTGHIQIIHPEPLQHLAEELELEIYLLHEIGAFVFYGAPLVRITGLEDSPSEETMDRLCRVVRNNIVVGVARSFEQDPRFGLLTMAQIASKALSPGINDPGTAIDIINRSGRILSVYRDETAEEDEPLHPRLHVRPLDPDDLIDDAFSAIARDGAAFHEVQQRLQKVMSGLMRHPDPGLCKAARRQAGEFLTRALDGMDWEPDRARLRASAEAGAGQRRVGLVGLGFALHRRGKGVGGNRQAAHLAVLDGDSGKQAGNHRFAFDLGQDRRAGIAGHGGAVQQEQRCLRRVWRGAILGYRQHMFAQTGIAGQPGGPAAVVHPHRQKARASAQRLIQHQQRPVGGAVGIVIAARRVLRRVQHIAAHSGDRRRLAPLIAESKADRRGWHPGVFAAVVKAMRGGQHQAFAHQRAGAMQADRNPGKIHPPHAAPGRCRDIGDGARADRIAAHVACLSHAADRVQPVGARGQRDSAQQRGKHERADHSGRMRSLVTRLPSRSSTSKRKPWKENTWPMIGIACAS